MRHSILFILLFSTWYVTAQQDNFEHSSSWNTLSLKADVSEKWFLKSEFNFRRTNFLDDWEQIVLRPSFQYKINSAITVALGYSYIQNYTYSDFSTPIDNTENNLWQQLFINQSFKGFTISHRLRFEERFQDAIKIVDGAPFIDGSQYDSRLRYRFIVDVPLFNKPDISVFVYDEVFLDFKEEWQPQNLDQNWMFMGFRFRESKHITIKSGYHYIHIPRPEKSITNNVWETTIIYTL